jgi:diaminopimelate decarboxylase
MPGFLAQQFHEVIPSVADYTSEIQDSFPPDVTLTTEIGSALVANAIDYSCQVVDIKQSGSETIIVTNGSKWDIKPNGSPKNLPLEVYSPIQRELTTKIQIVGYTCMENDVLFDGEFKVPSIGDFLIFKNCGAYAQSSSPDFIQQKKGVLENGSSLI